MKNTVILTLTDNKNFGLSMEELAFKKFTQTNSNRARYLEIQSVKETFLREEILKQKEKGKKVVFASFPNEKMIMAKNLDGILRDTQTPFYLLGSVRTEVQKKFQKNGVKVVLIECDRTELLHKLFCKCSELLKNESSKTPELQKV